MTPPLLSPEQCAELIAMFDDDARFRSTVVMARYAYAYGEGSYRYFADTLPRWSRHVLGVIFHNAR